VKQIQARVIASLVEVAGGRTQEWFDGLKPVDQKKYLKEHPSSKFGQKSGKPAAGPGARGQAKGPGTVKSLNKTKDEITNIRQANAKMKEIKEQLDKATKARPRTEEGKKAKALAIKKLTKLHDGIKRHKDDLIYYAKQKPLHLPASPTKRDAPKSAPAEKTGAKDQPAPKAAPKGAPAGSRAAKPGLRTTVPKGSSSAGGPKGAPRASKFAGIGGGGKPAANPATKPKGIPRR
jgi:hypothetical protein